MTTETTPPAAPAGPHTLARQRRHRSAVRFWTRYRTHHTGLAGLTALALFALVALTTPPLPDPRAGR
jgi:peptide/nickel transport system permease protein